ncbi:MAG: DNA polymerase III subunit gamma/tau [candidate division Zixibacteria bacterium]|nr:DNA polymerase III subunit gamma/tau [candidate division Zixibacteria bacterium]
MSYLVFARKYRPQLFSDVVAQDHVTKTLKNAIRNNRVGSAYLFCGPRGTGKTTCARILAKAINCAKGDSDEPCGVCPSCVEITSGSSLDVLEIDAASNTGVDDIRTLRENVRYLPTSGKKRIYIIDEVHRLSGSAFDALLKTLEEPPSHVVFMFATTDPLKLPETILSRTQRFDFRRVSVDDLASHLGNIAKQENVTIEPEALRLLARKADGSVRDSLSLLDQIVAFSGNKITGQDVILALGLIDKSFITEFVKTVAAADRRGAILAIKTVVESGIEAKDFLVELLEHFRILLVMKSEADTDSVLSLSQSEVADYKSQVDYFSVGDLLRLIKIGTEAIVDAKSGLDERLVLEIAAVRMADLESTILLADVLDHLKANSSTASVQETSTEGGKSKESGSSPTFFARDIAPVAMPAPMTGDLEKEPMVAPHTRMMNLAQLQAGWEGFLTVLRKSSPMLASQMSMSEPRELNENKVTAVFFATAEASLSLVRKPDNTQVITRALRDHYRTTLSVHFDIDKRREDPREVESRGGQPKINADELLARSAHLRMIIEKVDGEIIGIKKID